MSRQKYLYEKQSVYVIPKYLLFIEQLVIPKGKVVDLE